MWAFTGFASDSATLKNPNKKGFLLFLWDNTARLLRTKKKIYKKSKLYLVAVSNWMKSEIKKSVLGDQTIIRIYNGIDSEIFKPYNKILARKELGLPLDKKIVAFGIKGWIDSNKIVDDYIGKGNVFFAAIGHSNIQTKNKNFVVLRYTENKELLCKYLSAADVFFYPTRGDSFGLTSAEALSCGTPIVTYNTDAIPEIVTHLETGYITQYQDTESAKAGLEYILNLSKENYAHMSTEARKRIIHNFSCEKMFKEYLALYKKLLEKY